MSGIDDIPASPAGRGGRAARSSRTSYLAGLALAGGTALFLFLGAGALGIIGSGRADRWYLAVFAVLLVGAAAARLRPAGMVHALLAAAATTVLVPVAVAAAGVEGTDGASWLDVTGLTGMYAGLFTLSALLFRRAATRAG